MEIGNMKKKERKRSGVANVNILHLIRVDV